MKEAERILDQQEQFVNRLVIATKAKRAIWLKEPADSDCVFCFHGKDLFIFRFEYGSDENKIAGQPYGGIAGQIRNEQFLWLPGVAGYEILEKLMLQAIMSPDTFSRKRKHWFKNLMSDLAKLR